MTARHSIAHGEVHVWPGGSLWIGRSTGGTDLHSHHALQLTVADGGDYLLAGKDGAWRSYRASVVASDAPHAFRGDDVDVAHLFVEPESTIGRGLVERFFSASPAERAAPRALDAASATPLRRALFDGWRQGVDVPALVEIVERATAALAGSDPPRRITDPRVLRAIEIVGSELEGRVLLEEVAREVGLSSSRLRHLFVAEVGLPFRRYVLWRRLQRVFAGLGRETMTEAAHAAGFADSAHMTRTFRSMLGIVPSRLTWVSPPERSP